MNGGCHKVKGQTLCAYENDNTIEGRCRMVEADTAFLFLGCIASIGAAVLCFIASRRGGSVRHSAV